MKIVFALALCFIVVRTAGGQTTLQIRLAEEQPAIGLTEATAAHSPTKVYLHPSTVITSADVRDAHVISDDGSTFSVAISFTSQGSLNTCSSADRDTREQIKGS